MLDAFRTVNLEAQGRSFQAVKDFTLEIRPGEILGLLGANGAGKTTAIKMICGLLEPTRGEIRLLGRKDDLRSAQARREIGYMSQKFTLYEDLTIAENLDFYAALYSVPQKLRQRRKDWALEIAGLTDQADAVTARLPGGWKQRVAFGAAVMHEPSMVFLDEPTSGVDPLARRVMWRMINDLADNGAAVLVVTHYLEEAEQCNRLAFMAAGSILAQGSPREVKRLAPGRLLEVEIENPARALESLRQHFPPAAVSLFGDRLHVALSDGEDEQLVRQALTAADQAPRGLEEVDFSLEDVFIALMERERRQETQAA